MTPEPAAAPLETLDETRQEAPAEEYELVLGRRQAAGVLFMGLVTLAVFSGVSYLAGKGLTARTVAANAVAVPEPPPLLTPLPTVEATIAPLPVKPADPLFANPVPDAVYIQMGAVERGVAVIFAEGLRKRGFDSFVAPGPNEKVFRVLIGPFRNAEAYQATKSALDDLGLSTFARRYQQERAALIKDASRVPNIETAQ